MKEMLGVYLLLLFGLPLALTIALAVRRRMRVRRGPSPRLGPRVPVEEIVTRVAGEREAEGRRTAGSRPAHSEPQREPGISERDLVDQLVAVPLRVRRYIEPEYRGIFPRRA